MLCALGAATRNLTRPSELTCGYSFPVWFEGAGFQSLAGSFVWAIMNRPERIDIDANSISFVFIVWRFGFGDLERSFISIFAQPSPVAVCPGHRALGSRAQTMPV